MFVTITDCRPKVAPWPPLGYGDIRNHYSTHPDAYRNAPERYVYAGTRNMRPHEAMAAEQRGIVARLRRELAAYAEAMKHARPVIAQWSEWERQTKMEGWR